jgi:hypothetical protein
METSTILRTERAVRVCWRNAFSSGRGIRNSLLGKYAARNRQKMNTKLPWRDDWECACGRVVVNWRPMMQLCTWMEPSWSNGSWIQFLLRIVSYRGFHCLKKVGSEEIGPYESFVTEACSPNPHKNSFRTVNDHFPILALTEKKKKKANCNLCKYSVRTADMPTWCSSCRKR